MRPLLRSLLGSLIVSCQAYPGSPLRDPRTISQLAATAVRGGAQAVRIEGALDIEAVRRRVDVPIIGLTKGDDREVYITPTVQDALDTARAGAHIIAIDGTPRPRGDGTELAATISALRAYDESLLVLADCGSLSDAQYAQAKGADLVATTLAGYTSDRPMTEGPDFAFLDELVDTLSIPVIAEGRIQTPNDAVEALTRGAFAVCVGTAITDVQRLTESFVSHIETGPR